MVIDQGGHATRAIAYTASGEIIHIAEAPIKTLSPNNLQVEHDAEALLQSVYAVIDAVSASLGETVRHVKQIGLATQRSSIVCWNKKNGNALSPVISWQDRRTSQHICQYSEYAQYVHELTGLYLNPHYGATKMRWCIENIPAVATALDAGNLCIAPMASFILFHLLENRPFVIDPANASRSLLMNYKTCRWQDELLDLFSVPKEVLPEIVLSKGFYGNLRLNLPSGVMRIPLCICTGDQSAAVFAEGALAADEVFVNAGTGAFILKPSNTMPEVKNRKMLASVMYADENSISYVIEGTVNGAGRALQWFSEQSNIADYASRLDGWCHQYSQPPVFINTISGVGSPYWVAAAKSCFLMGEASKVCGLNEVNDEARFVAVLESIVFLIAQNIETIEAIAGRIRRIRLAGGIAKSKSFCEKLSALLGKKVVLLSEHEATAKGVWYLLSGRKAQHDLQSCFVFESKQDKWLESRYKHWQEVMQQRFT